MKIGELDKNFIRKDFSDVDETVEYSLDSGKFDVYGGIFYDEERKSYARIPHTTSIKLGEIFDILSSATAGGRIKFSTNSNKIGVRVKWRELYNSYNMPLTATSGFILLEEKGLSREHVASFFPYVTDEYGFSNVYDFRSEQGGNAIKERDFILYCPLYNNYIEEIYIILEKGATVKKGKKYKDIRPILYYGSSITQGGCVSRPDNAYQAFIERWSNVDYINLGFSGNALGEPEVAKYIAELNPSIFVCDYDYNAPNSKHLKDTHYNFYKAFRAICPNTPIIFMTKPDYRDFILEDRKRYKVIKDSYNSAKKEGDENVFFVDGRKIFGVTDRNSCTVDKCHPNDLGHYFIAKALYKIISKLV